MRKDLRRESIKAFLAKLPLSQSQVAIPWNDEAVSAKQNGRPGEGACALPKRSRA